MDLFLSSQDEETGKYGANTVTVIPLRPVAKGYSYRVPGNASVKPGDYVRIPIANSESLGVVWDSEPEEIKDKKRLKEISEIYDIPPMPLNLRRFIEWAAAYTLTPIGSVLKSAAAGEVCIASTPSVKVLRLADNYEENLSEIRMTDARRRVIECLENMGSGTAGEISGESGVTPSVIKGLEDGGILVPFKVRREDVWANTIDRLPDLPEMSVIQRKTADSLVNSVKTDKFSVSVLDGVTGSGKTEVYFAPVRAAVSAGKQVLVLVPEIALTQQFISRFKKRFGTEPAQWHSAMTPAQKRKVWRGIAKGTIQVTVGARSALFLPYKNPGLIIVDEEHDPSYKQEDGGPVYQARDMAVARARYEDCPVILVSATPSLETVRNVWEGKYKEYHLPDRHGGAVLPDVTAIDMRKEKLPRQAWISPTLIKEIEKTLEAGEQVLLFLNRRGYAPLTLCRTCGFRLSCPKCTSWLVEHKQTGRLLCHHCGYNEPFPEFCPECEAPDTLASCGPGVERIHEEILKYFPTASVGILSSDIQRTSVQLSETLDAVAERKFDIIIGTQILAKGHHFPHLTLVGIIDADSGLSGSDLRAGERTFQLLQQVAGRAGRESRKGKVLIQTYLPEHPLMQALVNNDRNGFYEQEAAAREQADMPPFSRLAAIIVTGTDENETASFAKYAVKNAPENEEVTILGPAPAVIYRLREKYRYRILVRSPKNFRIQTYIREWMERLRIPKGTEVNIDIDPYNFM